MATITISFDVDDEMQVILLQNFNEMADKSIQVNVDGYVLPYIIEGKKELENNLEFGKRFIKETVFNAIEANMLNKDRGRYHSEVDEINKINANVPANLLT